MLYCSLVYTKPYYCFTLALNKDSVEDSSYYYGGGDTREICMHVLADHLQLSVPSALSMAVTLQSLIKSDFPFIPQIVLLLFSNIRERQGLLSVVTTK